MPRTALYLCTAFAIACAVVLSPNPFGNNPDIIADESYFLTSSLQALEHHTLPGWEFSVSGNYYGGPQTYLDFAVLIPVVGVLVVASGFSIFQAEAWVALHTGDLLHVVRLANGAFALAVLAGCIWYFYRRRVPAPLAQSLALFALLLFGSSIVVQFLHTAKVWVLYISIVGAVSALFMAQRYYREHEGRPFIPPARWAGLLLWAAAILAFQNYVGAFSVAVIGIYALVLGDLSVRDFWEYVRRYWYWFAGLAVLQVSFIYRALFINLVTGSFAEISTLTPDHHILWLPRLLNPLRYVALGDPLAVALYLAAAAGVVWMWYRSKQPGTAQYAAIALAHPLITYLFFHVVVGFSSAPRYGIMLVMACSLSAAILVAMLGPRARYAALAVAGSVALVVGLQAVHLYWQPSSEVLLVRTIEANYNDPAEVFIEEESALRLTLPTNTASLGLLNDKRASMSRFEFMQAHPEVVDKAVTFKPLTAIVYGDAELMALLERFAGTHERVWTISTDCTRLCSAQESAAGTCFEVNTAGCPMYSQEVNLLPAYISYTRLGNPYIVRRANI